MSSGLNILFAVLLFTSSLQVLASADDSGGKTLEASAAEIETEDSESSGRSKKCPDIECKDDSYKYLFFRNKESSDDSAPDLSSRLLTQFTTSVSGKFDSSSTKEKVLASVGTDYLKKCIEFCKSYNRNAAAAGGATASYWTFWLAYDSKSGKSEGRCLCYANEVCYEKGDSEEDSNSGEGSKGNGEERYKECGSPISGGTRVSIYVTGHLCGSGGVGDPHFTGADKSHFDFTGVPNHHYALLSDRDVQVNALFGGRYDEAGKAMTWMRKVGVVYRTHSIALEAREGPEWRYGSGYMQRILVDNHPLRIDSVGESADFSFADGTEMKVTWLLAEEPSGDDFVDKYEVRLGKQLAMVLTLRPEVSTHRTPQDGLVHFSVNFAEAKLSQDAHGVLGQTYRSGFEGRLKLQRLVWSELLQREVVAAENGEGFLDGSAEDYLVSSLLSTECELCRFQPRVAISRKMLM